MFPSRRPRRTPLPPSVVELDGPFTHELVHTRGVRLHVATAGDPTDPLIVLLHGAFSGWFEYREVIAPLAARGFHVVAVDARGHGLSDKPPATAGDELRTAAGDIAGVIRSLGHERAIVVGSDAGGAVAWALTTYYPEIVAGLVPVAAAHPVDMRRSLAARPWNHPWSILRALASRLPWPLWRTASRLVPAAYRRHLSLSTTPEFRRSPAFRENLDLWWKAAQIGNTRQAVVRSNRLPTSPVVFGKLQAPVSAPTLLLQPPQRVWRHLERRMRQRITGPVEVRHIPGTRRLPQLENPGGFVDAVAEFARMCD